MDDTVRSKIQRVGSEIRAPYEDRTICDLVRVPLSSGRHDTMLATIQIFKCRKHLHDRHSPDASVHRSVSASMKWWVQVWMVFWEAEIWDTGRTEVVSSNIPAQAALVEIS
ncbi:hypothetical protein SCP_1004880 [Sparassis crispa]|uniref:Uncharacterized protein n=1 Tax=Sparassis crispa TaxID=139825 RepID=A0A401GYK4_9APHY|nr:hypothetical protein SCP_1004880 [Sparassis crispa]GBE87241.1 hypothetical protein SCP_1004880 [Sparassis crispa]